MEMLKLNPTPLVLQHLLEGTFEYASPKDVLASLSAELAFKQVNDYPHSIAQLVSHLHFWQQRRLTIAQGDEPFMDPDFEFGVTDFPKVEPEDWDKFLQSFLASCAELLATAKDPDNMDREVFEDRNVGFVLASHALHNAYHLGQIVVLRSQLGDWPVNV